MLLILRKLNKVTPTNKMEMRIKNRENKEFPGKFKALIPLYKEIPSIAVNRKDNLKIKLKLKKKLGTSQVTTIRNGVPSI